MASRMKVTCGGPDHSPHTEVSFELKLVANSPTSLEYAVQDACPICTLTLKVSELESTVNGQWDDLRKAQERAEELKDMMEAFRPMREWWEATCKIEDALKQPEPNEPIGNQPGDPW